MLSSLSTALTGALSNSPPSFSESYYVDSVSEEVENDGLLTTVTCSDSDGEDLILNVTSDLPFRTRVVASGVSPNQFDIVVADSAGIDLSLEYSGISFTLVCSDGVANDTAEVALNVVPTSAETPEFTNAPNPVRILSSVQMGTTIATYRASVSLHSSRGALHEIVVATYGTVERSLSACMYVYFYSSSPTFRRRQLHRCNCIVSEHAICGILSNDLPSLIANFRSFCNIRLG